MPIFIAIIVVAVVLVFWPHKVIFIGNHSNWLFSWSYGIIAIGVDKHGATFKIFGLTIYKRSKDGERRDEIKQAESKIPESAVERVATIAAKPEAKKTEAPKNESTNSKSTQNVKKNLSSQPSNPSDVESDESIFSDIYRLKEYLTDLYKKFGRDSWRVVQWFIQLTIFLFKVVKPSQFWLAVSGYYGDPYEAIDLSSKIDSSQQILGISPSIIRYIPDFNPNSTFEFKIKIAYRISLGVFTLSTIRQILNLPFRSIWRLWKSVRASTRT